MLPKQQQLIRLVLHSLNSNNMIDQIDAALAK
jgi:hypothetical protein